MVGRGVEPAGCRNGEHAHHGWSSEAHRHLDLVVLADGTRVTAASFDPLAPYARGREPDDGLYLDHRWQPPWDHGHVDWPDFGVPADPGAVAEALRAVLQRSRAGQHVEVGCLGGHGRTGTALACLAVLAGDPAGDATPSPGCGPATAPRRSRRPGRKPSSPPSEPECRAGGRASVLVSRSGDACGGGR